MASYQITSSNHTVTMTVERVSGGVQAVYRCSCGESAGRSAVVYQSRFDLDAAERAVGRVCPVAQAVEYYLATGSESVDGAVMCTGVGRRAAELALGEVPSWAAPPAYDRAAIRGGVWRRV